MKATESEKARISLQHAVCCVLCAAYACMVYSVQDVRIQYDSNPSTLCNRTNSKARHTFKQRKQHQAFLEICL